MSRAFMKDRDDAPEPVVVIERSGPILITAAGLATLREQVAGAASAAERARLVRVIEQAEVAALPADRRIAALGATVRVDGAGPGPQTFALVGDIEADPAAGKIGISSPLAVALLGRRVGDSVVWERPAGNRRLTLRAIAY